MTFTFGQLLAGMALAFIAGAMYAGMRYEMKKKK